MKVSNKAFEIATKYLDSSYVKGKSKMWLVEDLCIMGVSVKPFLDEDTVRDIAIVVSRRILESRLK